MVVPPQRGSARRETGERGSGRRSDHTVTVTVSGRRTPPTLDDYKKKSSRGEVDTLLSKGSPLSRKKQSGRRDAPAATASRTAVDIGTDAGSSTTPPLAVGGTADAVKPLLLQQGHGVGVEGDSSVQGDSFSGVLSTV